MRKRISFAKSSRSLLFLFTYVGTRRFLLLLFFFFHLFTNVIGIPIPEVSSEERGGGIHISKKEMQEEQAED